MTTSTSSAPSSSDGLPRLADAGGGVWTIMLDRPRVLNALTADVLDMVGANIVDLANRGARAVVLHGAGRAFSAGGDVKAIRAMPTREHERYLSAYGRLCETITKSPIGVVAALHGHVYGGGLEIACMADVRVVDPNTRLCGGDIAIGMIPTGGLTWTLPRLMGRGRAAWMLLTNAVVTGEQAVTLGLCDLLSAPGAHLDAALQAASQIATYAPHAVAATKQALRFGDHHTLAESIRHEIDADLVGLGRADVKELLARMFERPALAD